jgi:hypothetical protein
MTLSQGQRTKTSTEKESWHKIYAHLAYIFKMMALMEMKIYSNCANALKKYFLPPFHDDLSYICRNVVVKFTPTYCPYNILPSMQHFCDNVQLPVSVVILKLLHQTQYNMQFVRMKDMNAILCHVNCHSYKDK